MDDFFEGLGVLVFAIVSIVGGTILNGYVFKVIWNWFVTPYLGLFPITIPIALGIVLIPQMLNMTTVYQSEKDKKEMKEHPWTTFFGQILLRPALFLFMGWIIQLFL